MISAATYRLCEGLFVCEDRGQPDLKGVAMPLTLYRVASKRVRRTAALRWSYDKGLTPLVGREHEFGIVAATLGASQRRSRARSCC